MKIDYTSDSHFDFYIHESKPITSGRVRVMLDRYWRFTKQRRGDVLIIAGDMGHYNLQNIEIMKHIKEQLGYKAIITVLGNHDRYLITKAQCKRYKNSSDARVNEFKTMMNTADGLYLLDGDIIEIDGVKFGGSGGWADGSYDDSTKERKQYLFEEIMSDYRKISKEKDGFDGSFDYFFKSEYAKLEMVCDKSDIMISHFVPLPEMLKERQNADNNFYTFNGEELLKKTSARYWIFGHRHQALESSKHKVVLLSSPIGYKEQPYNQTIRQIEV